MSRASCHWARPRAVRSVSDGPRGTSNLVVVDVDCVAGGQRVLEVSLEVVLEHELFGRHDVADMGKPSRTLT